MVDSLSLAGKTAIVTGAGAGLGRAEALALADAGAAVVVNDMGSAAHDVVDEIKAAGGQALAVTGDVSDWSLGGRMIQEAVSNFGSMDILVNNAGILRDKMIFNLSESDWDDVIRVHLKGHAATSHAAAVHWRQASKDAGGPDLRSRHQHLVRGVPVRLRRPAQLFGRQGRYHALTLSTAAGLSRYGVRANAICPRARTAMTAEAFGTENNTGTQGLDPLAPERVGTLVRYLASPASDEINGQVFVVYGKMVALMAAPQVENRFDAAGPEFSVESSAGQMTPYFSGRGPYETYAAYSVAGLEKIALATDAPAGVMLGRRTLHEASGQGCHRHGGAGGIGRAITRVFSREGAKVLFVDISDENGFAIEKEIAEAGGEGKFLNVDISQKDSAEAIRDAAVAAFGRIDILVNNAHASRQAPLLEQTQEMFDLSFGTGFYPTVHLMQACYPQLKESKGSIINFGSSSGLEGMPTQTSYAAAKEAIRGVSRVAANEWAADQIRVNVLCPVSRHARESCVAGGVPRAGRRDHRQGSAAAHRRSGDRHRPDRHCSWRATTRST